MTKALIDGELIIAVDFDGTITTEPDIGKKLVLRENCKEVLQRMSEDGIKLILWTCRSGEHLAEAISFLDNSGLLELFDVVNKQLPQVVEKYPDEARKVGADVYFDDKNAMGIEVNWDEFEKFIYGGM